MSPASPSIVTTPSLTSVTLSTSSRDAERHGRSVGGYYERARSPSRSTWATLWSTPRQCRVSGNGSYTTPTGYTLPTTGTVVGTYQWNSSFSGDTNNTSASENNARGRAGDGQPGQPDDRHHPKPDCGHLGSASVTISGTKYLDLTGNGFTSDDTPQGGVTIDLYQQVGSNVTLVGTTVDRDRWHL